jgi:dTDP-4-dehydrorhamnose 3,5-epimerase-like enzyme
MDLINLIDLPTLGDERGGLIALESNDSVPFEIKRVYYIIDTKKGISRGFHAHKKLKQLVICVSGSCQFVLDDGINRESVILNDPMQGLLVNKMIWREMHNFSNNCILLVIASQHYCEDDYIRNYQSFLEMI